MGTMKEVVADATAAIKPSLRGVSHQFACAAALSAGLMLIDRADTPQAFRATCVFVCALTFQFAVSAIYHTPNWPPHIRQWLKRLDHACIHNLIAATYTPVCMLALDETVGRRLITIVWSGAIAGMLKSMFWPNAPKLISAPIYVALGWAVVPFYQELISALSMPVLVLLTTGGVLYTIGAVIFTLQWPDPLPKTFGYHEIFHVFVILASALHFTAINLLVKSH